MPKLHELLAAEGTAKAQTEKCRTELAVTFEKKRHLFASKIVQFVSTREGEPTKVEEQSDIQTTVRKELEWIADIWAKSLDLAYNIDAANQHAVANVVLDNDKLLLSNAPATALLQLEKRVQEIRTFLLGVPTLDPAKGFKPDPNREVGVYVSRETEKKRTAKLQRPIVLYDATDKHPAQTQLIVEDIPIGTIVEREWSAMLTPAEKADIVSRCDEVLKAVKTARARANNIDAGKDKIGSTLFGYILNGKS